MTGKIRWLLSSILVAYAVLALAYSVVNPIFESPDELLHYRYIRALIDQRQLPVQVMGDQSEAHQPPLYYLLLLPSVVPVPNDHYTPGINPFWAYDLARPGVDNKSLYIHSAVEEGFPYHGTALAVHLARLLSILIGALTLWVNFRVLSMVFVDRPYLALAALAFIAFNPQFIFISASINNDNLVTFWGALILWWSVRVVKNGLSAGDAWTGGLMLGAALLSKVSAGSFIVVMFSAVWLARLTWRERIITVFRISLMALLVSGWWFVRNIYLYGDLTGIQTMLKIWAGGGGAGLHDPQALAAFWQSLWGRFGYGQIVLPGWIYAALGVVCGLSLLGAAFKFRRVHSRSEQRPVDGPVWIVIVASPIVLLAALALFGSENPTGMHGRLMFPAIGSLAALLVVGWRGLGSRDIRQGGRQLCVVCHASMFGFALLALIGYLRPAYSPPAFESLADVRTQLRSTDIHFGNEVSLLGYTLDRDRARPGDDLQLKLCWQTLAAKTSPLYFFVHLLGQNDQIVGQRNSLHGLSRYPSINWEANRVFCDDVAVRVADWTPTQEVYAVEVGVVDLSSKARLAPTGPANQPLSLTIIAQIKVGAGQPGHSPVSNAVLTDWGGQVKLIGSEITPTVVQAGQTTSMTLYWQAMGIPQADYTVFVHLISPDGRTVAYFDAQPRAGRYPMSFWDAGEVIADLHKLDMPANLAPGEYAIQIGLYQLDTGQRLPVNGDPGGAFEVGRLTIEARQ